MNKCCKNLDDYLDGDLSQFGVEDFLLAAESCSACQSAIEAHRESCRLLQTGWKMVAAPAFDPAIGPDNVTDSFSQATDVELIPSGDQAVTRAGKKVASYRTEKSLISAGGITLLICLIVSGVWIASGTGDRGNESGINGQANEMLANRNSQNQSYESNHQNERMAQPSNKATVELSDSHLGVRLDDEDDDFTFIQVYQAVDLSKIERSEPGQPSL